MPVPYYPGITVTPNLGLSLIGQDEVVAQNFVLLDAAVGGGGGAVSSVFGRTGAVVAVAGDYTLAQITGTNGASNLFLATPNGASGNASLRAIVAADLPTDLSSLTLTVGNLIDNGLTASQPVFTNSSKQLVSGTLSGNTTKLATVSGALTSGHLVSIDVSGNLIDGGAPPTAPVTSVFGRTGAVVAVSGDYSFSLISGTIFGSQLPVPGVASLGGVFSKAAVTHQFLTSISSVDGSIGQAQPAFTDISGTAGLAQGGTGVDLSASGSATAFLAQNGSHVISARSIVSGDLPDLSGTYQVISAKDAASGYAGLTASIFLKDAEFTLTRNAQTGTTYTVLDGDRAKVVTFSNSSPIAVTLPQAGASSSFLDGWFCTLKNIGTGTVTVTPTTSTIETTAKMIIPPGASCRIMSDGTNYFLPGETVSRVTGLSLFTTDGTPRPLAGVGAAVIVSTANAVIGLICNLDAPCIVNKVQFGFNANASGSTQTADMGIYDSTGNLIFNVGSTSKLNGAGATFPSASPTGGILLLGGTYVAAWTCSSTTPTFICNATGTAFIGGNTSGFLGNLTTKVFINAGNAATGGGALPSTLGTMTTSALGSGDTNGNIPIILFIA